MGSDAQGGSGGAGNADFGGGADLGVPALELRGAEWKYSAWSVQAAT